MIARLRKKNLHKWLPQWLAQSARAAAARSRRARGPRHLLFAFCDHYEPLHGNADAKKGQERVDFWHEQYPRMAADFRDASGRPPRHSFFFPGEQYQKSYLDPLADLAKRGFGEVEVHLHHDGDTAAKLRSDISTFLDQLVTHGHLSRGPGKDGKPRFAFIHGNWCLANARADGRWCGVDEEIPLLFDLGCYADFTFPAAPDESQPGIVNQIYWPQGDLARRRAYEQGSRARVGETLHDRMLFIEGPLAMALRPGKPVPRIDSAAITAIDPGSRARVKTWVGQDVHVLGRPEWLFVKVHTHGAPDKEGASLLGDGGQALHRALAEYNDGSDWVLHYVTAREMYNIAMAAMGGATGNPDDYRDHVLAPPPVAAG